MGTLIFFILLTLGLSAFFSGSEIAFISANKLGIEVLNNKGSKRGKVLANFYKKPKEFLGTMLVGNNIVLVIFTILMTELIEPILIPILGDDTLVILLFTTLIITIIVLLLGEFLPKTLFRLYSNDLLFKLAYPLQFFKWLLSIPTLIMTGLSNFLFKYILKTDLDELDPVLTKIDLEHYIHDTISEEEDFDKEILTNALNLSQVKVRDCMIPRTEIVCIDKGDDMDELLNVFRESRLSRILVIDGDIEIVLGYIHHQQLLENPQHVRKIILPIPYVPKTMNVQDLLMKFIKEGSSIACVVDEFGGTAGMITMEDILEEIFGEIEDEHDVEGFIDKQISEDEYLFSGRLEIDYLNEKYENLEFPNGEFHTLSGYIVMTSESIPKQGDQIQLNGYRFDLVEVSDTKIETVKVEKLYDFDPED